MSMFKTVLRLQCCHCKGLGLEISDGPKACVLKATKIGWSVCLDSQRAVCPGCIAQGLMLLEAATC